MHGTVKFYNTEKGFGFISPDDVYVHVSAGTAAGITLAEGDRITFDTQQEQRGTKAVNLKKA